MTTGVQRAIRPVWLLNNDDFKSSNGVCFLRLDSLSLQCNAMQCDPCKYVNRFIYANCVQCYGHTMFIGLQLFTMIMKFCFSRVDFCSPCYIDATSRCHSHSLTCALVMCCVYIHNIHSPHSNSCQFIFHMHIYYDSAINLTDRLKMHFCIRTYEHSQTLGQR